MKFNAIILAAGKGARMKSKTPKVLHNISGKPMVSYVVETARKIGAEQIVVVVGADFPDLRAILGSDLDYVVQEQQLGTGDAVKTALPALKKSKNPVLVMCGDTPLLSGATLNLATERFYAGHCGCVVLTTHLDNPSGYGRIIRQKGGSLAKIVEERDASGVERSIKEINGGVYCFDGVVLAKAIEQIRDNNVQGEYYLTDAVKTIVNGGYRVQTVTLEDAMELQGVNDRSQLSLAINVINKRNIQKHLGNGVTIIDPSHTYIDSDVEIGADTIIEPGCYLRGQTVIGEGCYLDNGVDIIDCRVGDRCHIIRSVLRQSNVGNNCNIGPFAYLRPGTVLAANVKVGDFVEIKNSNVGPGSKIPHLSYVGDSDIGAGVNLGCGTITCNYDGFRKYRTVIEDGVFIGSNSNLIAPVKVNQGAFVAAGSTIDQEVPEGALAITRVKQRNLAGWAVAKREKEAKEKDKG